MIVCVRACVHACVRACMRACADMCACVCGDVCTSQVLRDGDVPLDAYVFQNVTGRGAFQAVLKPLRLLWREVTLASLSDAARGGHRWIQMHLASTAATSGATPLPGLPDTGLLLPLVRLGVGGTGSGAPFHDHMPAINVAFAGRKRWLVAKPGTELVLVGPNDLLKMLPQQEFQAALAGLERGGKMWQCTQQPGEAVYVPAMFLHAIVNMDEVVSVAIQADDHDPAAAFAALLANAGVDGALRLVQESQRQGYGDLARYISDLLPK